MAEQSENLVEENRRLRRRLADLETRVRELETLERASASANEQYGSLVNQLAIDVEDVLKSARWRLGNAFVRAVEILLFRKKGPLLLHHIRDLLDRHGTLGQHSWKLGSTVDALPTYGFQDLSSTRPLAECLESVDFSRTAFARWLSDSRIAEARRRQISDAVEQELADIAALFSLARVPDELPLVSIIMPAYNRQDVIGEPIQSVIEQSYGNWELLICDDGSEDSTREVAGSHDDPRIQVLALDHRGAAAARNAGLGRARGQIVAYLDSDNIWHPQYLAVMVATLLSDRGRYAAYSAYLDLEIKSDHVRLRSAKTRAFDFEALARKNFVDLNSFVHWRELFDCFGGFTESLARQQDWDLILKYSFLRDPLIADFRLVIYRRNPAWNQLTELREETEAETQSIVGSNLARYYRRGLPPSPAATRPKVTVLVWDICRNHFSKAYNIAEALAKTHPVELIGFRFFQAEIFPPYAEAEPPFETHYFQGCDFPEFFGVLRQALARISGDIIYCVKPRLPSLGLALLANYHRGTPFIIECNDLESVVSNPDSEALAEASVPDLDDPDLKCPYHQGWTRYLEQLVQRAPLKVTHNQNLNRWLGGHCVFQRNVKDEIRFDPDRFDRDRVRSESGFEPGDRVILFAGLVRRHKGIFELKNMLEAAPANYRLLVIGSRKTPDLERLQRDRPERLVVLPPVDRNEIAGLTASADAVVLWLDPATPASHYQMPFKLTDALAMGVPVFANPVSDLAELIEHNVVCHAPYGRGAELVRGIETLLADEPALERLRQRGRNLFLRQFGYQAARANFAILEARARQFPPQTVVTDEFAELFDRYYRKWKPANS